MAGGEKYFFVVVFVFNLSDTQTAKANHVSVANCFSPGDVFPSWRIYLEMSLFHIEERGREWAKVDWHPDFARMSLPAAVSKQIFQGGGLDELRPLNFCTRLIKGAG